MRKNTKYTTPEIEFIHFEVNRNLMTEFYTTHPNEGNGDEVFYGESQTTAFDDDL